MHKTILKKLKVITNDIVIAFFMTSILLFVTGITLGPKIEKTMALINKLTANNQMTSKIKKNIQIDKIQKKLTEYPSYGETFGTIEIPTLDINIALYHGESISILKYGAGHHAGSYFPGEGGSIIIAAHNTYGMFYNLPKIKIGDKVIIKTTYGTYTYQINKTEINEAKIIGQNLKINKEEETIMLYTCYPVEIPGYKSKRFIAYGNLIGDNNA